ncbi:MAG: butyrate kinase [Desulfovibrionales bacterium]|nr:butyrate kinase [Desulfovibrionales bacterium]
MNARVLVINPGSTSTKIAVFAGDAPVFVDTLRHPAHELSVFSHVMEQEEFRAGLIFHALQKHDLAIHDMQAVIGRGGLMRPIPGGVYAVNQAMLDDLRSCAYGAHASNLGAILAHALAAPHDLPCYIADPVVVDELGPLARYSGHPDIVRRSIFHALNHKAVARRVAAELGQPYTSLRLIVAHLGGGISVGAHDHGRVVDVNNALDGDGPFSPERGGSLPAGQVVSWCFSPGAQEQDIRQRITGHGGCLAYVGTTSGMEICQRMNAGDAQANAVHAAMAYQVAKEIGAMATVLAGQVQAIIVTGGLAFDPVLVQRIRERVEFLAPVFVCPGEDEMTALAQAATRALRGLEPVLPYPPAG